MNRIIFGGAFEPVHNGHINMAENAKKALNGEVIFVPARISVWKENSAPIEDKIAMLELAIKNKDGFSIEKYEIENGKDVTYSIDTVSFLKEKYPNDKLFLLIGTDQVNEFYRWKEAERISELVKIVYFSRPGYQINQEMVKRFNMQQIPGQEIDISSTNIRKLLDFELPDEVLFYIVEHDLYEGMVELNKILTPHRLAHSKSVAKLAYEIAVSNKLERPIRYFLAGLFHDIGKDIPIEQQFEITKKHFPEYADLPEFAYHQFAGSILVQEMFKITDQDIVSAIRYHSTGSDDMCLMAKIIYASDKIEPTRGFDSSRYISEMKKDANNGFRIVLQANKDYLGSKHKSVSNLLTYKCFSKYL